ncbi:MAG: hypothetical protein ABR968_04190 [Bacteroidales bacterium]|jgi:hypothetical protein
MAHKVESIPAGNYPFMVWLANYATQIQGFITGGPAPDGFPYFFARAIYRWDNIVMPAITALQSEWLPVSAKGGCAPAQSKQFTNDKKNFLKKTLRPWNKEFVLYNSAFTVQNRATIGILPVASSARRAAGLTEDQLFASFKPLGSCVYELSCKTSHEAKHSSCPNGKIVQMSYRIDSRAGAGQTQAAVPISTADCSLQDVSTHALFTHDFGGANAGKIMYVFFRWFDIHHPEKSGPWSILYIINLA